MAFWIPIAVAVGFALWWSFVLWVLGWASGWRRLARAYPAPAPFLGARRSFQSVQLGWSNYGNCATVGTNAAGIYLAVFVLVRPGHPPFFVPWTDVSAEYVRRWFAARLELRFAAAPGIVLRFPKRLGQLVAADANRSWAGGDSDVPPA